jgi:hypothetical protein
MLEATLAAACRSSGLVERLAYNIDRTCHDKPILRSDMANTGAAVVVLLV